MVRPTGKEKQKQLPRLAWIAATGLFLVLVLVVSHHKYKKSSSSSVTSNVVVSGVRTRPSGESPWFALLPDDEFTPKIVWLLAMPNAGTSFCMTLMQRATNRMMATNYADEVTREGDYSLSIYPRHIQGPYWAGLGASKLGLTVRELPTDYVMVQTHCEQDVPGEKRSLEEFIDDCRQTFGRSAPDASVLQQYHYPTSRVRKSIHLIRNPYHQMVANFREEYKLSSKEWREKHPDNNAGLKRWCGEQEDKELDAQNYPADLFKELQSTTCHAQVAQYVQWHNMAFQMESKLELETMVVHYEDFGEETLTRTLDEMVDLLELEKEMTPTQKIPSEDGFDAYLTKEERKQIRHLCKIMASPET